MEEASEKKMMIHRVTGRTFHKKGLMVSNKSSLGHSGSIII